ncbi:MAG: site-specific integrase [Fusobacteriaceae bacterium]
MKVNPYQNIKPLKETEKEKDIWTKAEFDTFIKLIDDEEDIYKALFTLAFRSGTRLSELLGLRWNDVTETIWTIKTVFVYNRLTKEYERKETPKSRKGIRTIQIDSQTILLLENVKKYHKEFVFAIDGVKPNGSHYSKKFDTLIKKHGLKRITFHGLRHSNVSHLIGIGVPSTLIAQRVGHSSSAFTERVYGHALLDTEKKIAQLLADDLK